MAANEETVSIDTVKKTLWDSLEALGENISGETLETLLRLINGGCNVIIPFDVEDETYTTEYTIAQINEANDGRSIVYARFPMESGYVTVPLIYSDEETGLFGCVSYGINGITNNVLYGHTEDGADLWRFITE